MVGSQDQVLCKGGQETNRKESCLLLNPIEVPTHVFLVLLCYCLKVIKPKFDLESLGQLSKSP